MTSIESSVYLSVKLTSFVGYLLDGNTLNGQTQYLTLFEFYENKIQQQQQTDQLRHETEEIRLNMKQMKNKNAKILAILTSQLQQKFSDIRNNEASQHNGTAGIVDILDMNIMIYKDTTQNFNKKSIIYKFNVLC